MTHQPAGVVYLCEWAGEVDLALCNSDILIELLHVPCWLLVS